MNEINKFRNCTNFLLEKTLRLIFKLLSKKDQAFFKLKKSFSLLLKKASKFVQKVLQILLEIFNFSI